MYSNRSLEFFRIQFLKACPHFQSYYNPLHSHTHTHAHIHFSVHWRRSPHVMVHIGSLLPHFPVHSYSSCPLLSSPLLKLVAPFSASLLSLYISIYKMSYPCMLSNNNACGKYRLVSNTTDWFEPSKLHLIILPSGVYSVQYTWSCSWSITISKGTFFDTITSSFEFCTSGNRIL